MGRSRAGGRTSAAGVRIEVVEEARNWVEPRSSTTRPASRSRVVSTSARREACRTAARPSRYVNSNNGTWQSTSAATCGSARSRYAYVDGRCEGWLPRGEVLVDVAQGFEYLPLRPRVRSSPASGDSTLRLAVSRTSTPALVLRRHPRPLPVAKGGIARRSGEGVNVVNLLQSQWGSSSRTRRTSPASRTSRRRAHDRLGGQENRQHVLGHMSLLGLRRPVCPGRRTARRGRTGRHAGNDDVRLGRPCHAQGGDGRHAPLPAPERRDSHADRDRPDRRDRDDPPRPVRAREWYRYLNAGYRLPLAGGTDKMSAEAAVGLYRTYARSRPDEEFSYESWCARLRAGRTFHSGGPLLKLTVDGAEIGDTSICRAAAGASRSRRRRNRSSRSGRSRSSGTDESWRRRPQSRPATAAGGLRSAIASKSRDTAGSQRGSGDRGTGTPFATATPGRGRCSRTHPRSTSRSAANGGRGIPRPTTTC